ERLTEVDAGFRLVALVPAEREQVADGDSGDQPGKGQPPTGDQRVPVPPDVELILSVDVRHRPLALLARWSLQRHASGDSSQSDGRAAGSTRTASSSRPGRDGSWTPRPRRTARSGTSR